ncbi:protein transport protein Sec31p [Monosporozyma unispora]|nr:protein transport protein S31 [Kazachstania unispora]
MVKLAEYPRTATFAWSHDRIPQIVTGTASGTIDADFSNESVLELWSLLATEPKKPIASLSTDAKFNDLDWSIDNKIIAGGLENGTLEFFKLNNNKTKIESIGKFDQTHKSAVNTVKFNPKQSNVLISGDNNGEILIWDTTKAVNHGSVVKDYTPLKPGTAMTSIEEIHSLAWNQSLAHVFASAGSSSFASIWDLKAKKEVIHLSYTSPVTGLKPQLSVVEWHPTNSTKLVTATGSDTEPAIIVWDLRNANTPLNTLVNGHSKGILSLDWCNQDEDLLLSSGRDNTVVLWNPTTGEQLTQYPPHGNWLFKTKFAPQAPDIFATASFDSKVEIQTLQNIVNELDQEQNVTKQQESETEFWNNVSHEESNEKPIVKKLQAPNWYENKSPAATWAFGGKLVTISEDGKSVNITKPIVPGLEQNIALNEALKTKDFKPLINIRLVKGIDQNNEDDWNLLDKLSMDGRDEFLRDTFALDDDDEEAEINNKLTTNNKEGSTEAGEQFFEKIENKFEPKGHFKLESDLDLSMTRKLISGNTKSVVSEALENDLLLESLIIALDSNDQLLKDKVKDIYFKKYGNSSSLSRVLYSVTSNKIEDMVVNMDVSQWKYIVKAINKFVGNDYTTKNKLLIQLGDRILESGDRQNAIAIYLSANSVDKVAAIWLKEFNGLEDIIKQENKTIYEAHSECLTEFVERFTVFSGFIGETKISNHALIAKFLEFVDLATASGNFFLAEAFLDILPDSNEEVKTEKERVLLASGKSLIQKRATITSAATGASNIKQSRYRASIPNNLPVQQPQTFPPVAGMQQPIQPTMTTTAMPPINPINPIQNNMGLPVKTAAPVRPNPYAPSATSAPSNPVTPSVNNNVPLNNGPTSSFIPPANPYATVAPTAAPVSPFAPQQSLYGAPAGSPTPPPQSGVLSGQTPQFNQKANDGWNDLPLAVKENKPSRAKPVTVAPVSVGIPPSVTPHTVNPSFSSTQVNQPPSRMTSVSTLPSPPPPVGFKRKESSANIDTTIEKPVSKPNPYAPQTSASVTPMGQSNSPYAPVAGSTPTFTPQPQMQHNAPVNPYAPNQSTIPPSQGGIPPPVNPYAATAPPPAAAANAVAPPPISKQAVAPPPPMSGRRKAQPHKTGNVADATSLLESVQRAPSSTNIVPPPQQSVPPPQQQQSQQAPAPTVQAAPVVIPEDQQEIIDFLKGELERVTPLTPKEYSKQLKDCDKRLKILYGHMERQDLLTQPTVDKLKKIVECLKNKQYPEAMEIHVDISTNNSQEGGNWLTGVKRLIGIAEATSS